MLVAGAGGVGFGLGRGAGSSDERVVAPADSGTDAEGDATTTTIGDADTPSQGDPANATANATADEAGAPAPAPPLGSPGTMSGEFKVGADGMPQYELVAERVTDSGIMIRALRGESWFSDELRGAGHQRLGRAAVVLRRRRTADRTLRSGTDRRHEHRLVQRAPRHRCGERLACRMGRRAAARGRRGAGR